MSGLLWQAALGLLVLASSAQAQLPDVQYQWKEKRNKDGIVIYTSKVPGSKYKAVRGVMVVKASLSSLVALVMDGASCAKWADLCKESRVHESISATEKYVYNYNDLPFPVSDRDALTHVVWRQDPQTLKVTMTSKATIGRLAKTQAVRIEEALSQWHFSPHGEGEVLVEMFAHINPNGPTPAWLTNRTLVASPFKTMSNMRRIVESGDYDQQTIEFVQNH